MYLNNDWREFLTDELSNNNFINLELFLEQEYKNKIIYPAYKDIFRTFNLLTPQKIKVVIIGQDPYHGKKQANGMAFSVCKQCKIPPSLKNIFKELVDDIGCEYPFSGDLTFWAKQGVFLINNVLTVQEAKANSHKAKGWENFTDDVIVKLSNEFENIVFILWGSSSQKKQKLIHDTKHLILKAPHPSPLSAYRGFFGSKHFSKINKYLKIHGKREINWALNLQ